MQARTRKTAVIVLLAAALAAGYAFRSWFASSVMPPPDRMQAETTQSYRYARMFSMEGSIPPLDSLVMHPDGFRTSQNSIFEEYIAGGAHRLAGGDFDDFIGVFSLFFPLLTVPLIFLWMRSAGYASWNSLGASALYAALLPALVRARGGSLYRETVALPMLVALGWLVERSLDRGSGDRRSIIWPVSAGLMLFACLAAWKVTAFISFFLFIYLIWRHWRRGDVHISLRTALAAAQIGASLILPHMRHDGALVSPATTAAALLLLPRMATVWYPVAATLLAVASSFASGGSSGHVSAVIVAKLRFLFSHPQDPSLLSDDARIFWVPGYTSPSPAQMVFLFGIPLLACAPGLPEFWREKRGTLLFWFLPLSLAGYLFFDRLLVFLAVALVPVIALSLKRKWAVIAAAGLILLHSAIPGPIASVISDLGLRFRDSSSLLDDRELDTFISWLRHGTDEDQAVLSFWHISGLVSAYAQRPVVTHTFFENEKNRETILEFARAMYMPEDSLVALMRERECPLVVYQADFLLDRSFSGLLYLAGLTEVPEDCVARLLHYRPGMLDSLVPVFQGPSLRVFELHRDAPPPVLPRMFLFQERYAHCYEDYDKARALLADPRGSSGYLADTGIEMNDPDMLSAALLLGLSGGGPREVTEMMLNDLIQLYIQGSYRLGSLAEDVESFIRWNGPRPDLRLLMARLYASEGLLTEARAEYSEVLEQDPGNLQAAAELELIETGMEGVREGDVE